MIDDLSEKIIKGIVVAHSKTGITIADIRNKYDECKTRNLLCQSDSAIEKYLKHVPNIMCVQNEHNETLWYCRGKTLTVHDDENDRKIFRTGLHPFLLETLHRHLSTCLPNNRSSYVDQCDLGKRKRSNANESQSSGRSRSDRVRSKKSHPDINNNSCSKTGDGSANASASGSSSGHGTLHQKDTNNNEQYCYKFTKLAQPKFCGYELVGDDFFMNIAKKDLKLPPVSRNGVSRIGSLCVSGQDIQSATSRLEKCQKKKIICNVGSMDLLMNRDFDEMCKDYDKLVRMCYNRGIEIVITTLVPFVNMHDADQIQKMVKFNQYLVESYSHQFRVIDICSCMIHWRTNYLCRDCYERTPNKEGLSLWSHRGRSRILNKIRDNLPKF